MSVAGVRRSPAVWLTSYGLSLLGKGIAAVVLPLLVLDRTGDVLAAGVLASVSTAASALTGLVSGLLVDRVDRRTVAVVSDLLAAVSLAALPLVDLLWGLNLAWFLAFGVLLAMIRIPGMTAQETLLPALVRLGGTAPGRLERWIAIRENLGNVLLLAGPGAGGLLIGLLGPVPSVLWVTAVTSVLAAMTTLLLDPRAGRVAHRAREAAVGALRGAMSDLVASWRFLARNRLVLGTTLVSAALVAVLASLQTTVLPAYFVEMDLAALTGLTLSALAGGGIVGSALYAALAGRVPRRVWFVVGMLGFGIGFALLGSLAAPWLVLAAAALVGFTNAPVAAILGVLTIEATPDGMRGRVLGAQNTLVLAAPALTGAPVAAIASFAGLGTAGIVLAVIAASTAVVALAAPAFRKLDGLPDPDDAAPGPDVATGAPAPQVPAAGS